MFSPKAELLFFHFNVSEVPLDFQNRGVLRSPQLIVAYWKDRCEGKKERIKQPNSHTPQMADTSFVTSSRHNNKYIRKASLVAKVIEEPAGKVGNRRGLGHAGHSRPTRHCRGWEQQTQEPLWHL